MLIDSPRKDKDFKVFGLIVTFNRDEELVRAINHLLNQTFSPITFYVVDNAASQQTRLIVEQRGGNYLSGKGNLGGAGGFALGMKVIFEEEDFDFIWTLDDDGYPDVNCLQRLVTGANKNNLEVASPLSIDPKNLQVTSNPVRFLFRKLNSVAKMQSKDVWANKGNFFNGVLFSRGVILKVGFPKAELFIRGDELDYFYRCRKIVRIGLISKAIFFHQSSEDEFVGSSTSHFSVLIPKSSIKSFYQIRNRGYLIRQYHLYILAIYDWVRYPIYFVIRRRDLKNSSFKVWSRIWILGFKRKLISFDEYNTKSY